MLDFEKLQLRVWRTVTEMFSCWRMGVKSWNLWTLRREFLSGWKEKRNPVTGSWNIPGGINVPSEMFIPLVMFGAQNFWWGVFRAEGGYDASVKILLAWERGCLCGNPAIPADLGPCSYHAISFMAVLKGLENICQMCSGCRESLLGGGRGQ